MKLKYFLVFLAFFPFVNVFSLSNEDIHKIALKIWRNECQGKLDGLTCWNKGECFGSFGIGHFIWYPEGKQECFQEIFPDLLIFLKSNGVILPEWLSSTKNCPWNCREEFYAKFNSPEMMALRQMLFDTRDLQAIFIAQRLEKSLPLIIEKLPDQQKKIVLKSYSRLASDPRGLYILIDYLNFKGEGTSPLEGYKGQGWGLRQVLERIPSECENIVESFIQAAKEVLTDRVNNAPPERNEKQWLKGWMNRINTYSEKL